MFQIHRTPGAVICAVALTATFALSGCAGPETADDSAGQAATPSASASQSPSASPSPTVPEPVTTTEKITKKEAIPFEKVTEKDPNLDEGTKNVTRKGIEGVLTKTYRVTYVDGEETDRTLVKEVVTKEPVDQVTSIGTRTPPPPEPEPEPEAEEPAASNCDPNYTGCVPIASDVDCAGGSGNGPAYASGPVRVTGADIYDLDADGDGVACE